MTLFTRDNLLWTVTFLGALGVFVASQTHLIPPAYAERVKDWASLIGFLSGYFAWSPLPSSPTHADGPLISRIIRGKV